MEAENRQSIEIAAWTHADDSALCAITVVDGVVWGAANARMPERAVAHIRHHAERGFTGTLLCTVDCPG